MCFIVWLPLFCIGKARKNRTEKAAVEQHIEKIDDLLNKEKQSFGVPQDADRVDVFAEYYVIKKVSQNTRFTVWQTLSIFKCLHLSEEEIRI